MAATHESNGTVFQAWFPHPLDEQLRKQAESERRSLSQTIRLAVEDKIFASGGGGAWRGALLCLGGPRRQRRHRPEREMNRWSTC